MANDPGPGTEPPTEAPTQPDPQQTGGLVETGPVDIPGVQDSGPADADAEAEDARPFLESSGDSA
jgi:hypothetical protein